jgi:hypothetical protein
MKMKKTAWSPIAIGMASAALIIAAAEANFFIPLGPDTSMGIGELFTTLSAAIGGPIASLTTIFVAYGVVGMLHPEYFPDLPSLYIILEDAIAHLSAMLMVVLIYTKFLYPRARRTGFFLAGWFLLVCAYYFLALLPLSVVFLNLIDPSRGATYFDFARGFLPEVLGTAIITILIWLAAPIRYRRPLWIGQDIVPDQDTE